MKMTVKQLKGLEMASVGCNAKEISVALELSKIYAQWIIFQYEKLIGVSAI